MSLRIWLPLDGDLRNQGVSDVTITPSTGAAVQTDGKIGQCYRPATITLTNLDDFSFNNSSFCFWAKTSATTSWQLIIGIDNSNLSQIHGIYVADTSRYKLEYNPSLNIYNAEIAQWHHYAFIIQSGKSQAYCDGVLKATSEEAVTDDVIGRLRLGVGTAISLNDVRIYDHALSAAEVREISQGLVLHYKLDDLENGVLDSSGYGHNGEIINTISTSDNTSRYNACVHISATNQKIKISNFPTSGFGNSYSFSWWAKISSASPMHWGFADGIRLNGMYTGRLWNTGDSSSNPLYKPGTTTQVDTPTVNVWHHWVMTGDGTTCKVYQDGVHWGTAKTYKAISGQTIYINGWDSGTSYSSNDYSISDFRIYCTTLDADAVRQLYEVGAKIDNKGGIHTYEFTESLGIEENAKFVNNSATSVAYDAATDIYTIVSPVGTSAWGYGVRLADTPALMVPYGATYRWTAEVWTPVALTVNTDYNNTATTTWAGNDNDATSTRLSSGTAIPANTWTRIYRGASNTHSSNTNHLSIRDYSSLGLVTNGQSGPVTWKIRHLQWYIVDTTFKPEIKKTGVFEAEHFTEVEQNLNKPAQFNKRMFSVNGNELIEL